MGTHVHTCRPSTGWDWLIEGLKLFRRKPGEMFLLGNTYLFVLLFVGMMVPWLGGPLMTLITPGLGAGIMIASRMASKGMRVTPIQLFAGFLEDRKENLNPLLCLGAAFTVCFALIKLFAYLVLGPQPAVDLAQIENSGANADQITALATYMVTYSAFVSVASIPVILLFWYAPALVVWHGMSAWKALFASWVATWRNKSTFVIFGMGWVLLTLALGVTMAIIFSALGAPLMLLMVMNILTSAIVMGITFGALYPSYRSVFEHDPHYLDITI